MARTDDGGFKLNRALGPLENDKTFRFATWDVEAQAWWKLVVIGVWDGSRYFWCKSVPDFINYILQDRYDNYRFFAHFGGRYDLNFIFDFIRYRTDIDVSFYCSGSMVIQMTLRRKGLIIKLCDSYRLLQYSLRELGIAFDVEHKKTEINYDDVRFTKQTLEYNEQDCRCLYEVLEKFFVETGVMSETFATHALKVWRKDFLKELIWPVSDEVSEFVRSSYHGGRVEVFKRESSDLNAYDVNSMYPFVMLNHMPVHYMGEGRNLDSKYFGFVEAEIIFSERYIPCLPVRLEKLYFPVGKFRGVWTTEELRQAEALGAVVSKVYKGVFFDTSPIFRGYINTLYALKKRSSEPNRTIAKLLMNSLYGKFGQNPTKKVFCMEHVAPDGATPIINPDGTPSNFAFYEKTSRASYLLPHLASAVTSKARLVLLSKLNENSYYCDTDSVFTSEVMPTSEDIGEWSEVGKGECFFVQPKLYKFKGNWKAKGLNREESIDAFVSGSVNTVIRHRSIKEALRSGRQATESVEVQKFLRESRPKRAWLTNNQDTRPWTYEELL